jgi:hypothetical protein
LSVVAENRLDTQVLAEQVFDVLIIGGGITGAWPTPCSECLLGWSSEMKLAVSDR